MSSFATFRYQHKGPSSWDTHPFCVTCRIREGLLCSRENPWHFCENWDENACHSQDIRVNKVRRDWESSERKMLSTPLSSLRFPGSTSAPHTFTMIHPRKSHGSARTKPMVANPLDISLEAVSLSQLWWSRPSQRPVATMEKEPTLFLNALHLLETAASLQDPLAPRLDKTPSHPKPVFSRSQEKITIEIMGEESPPVWTGAQVPGLPTLDREDAVLSQRRVGLPVTAKQCLPFGWSCWVMAGIRKCKPLDSMSTSRGSGCLAQSWPYPDAHLMPAS